MIEGERVSGRVGGEGGGGGGGGGGGKFKRREWLVSHWT